jgi:hypothetical protein
VDQTHQQLGCARMHVALLVRAAAGFSTDEFKNVLLIVDRPSSEWRCGKIGNARVRVLGFRVSFWVRVSKWQL